ncbi:MAG: PEPxxWA-CTERM sorting domain-containing protein [Rhizomicrobium sp.]
MNFKRVALGGLLSASIALLGTMSAANASTYVYAGNWQVDSGPHWSDFPPNGPLAYTGQQAAALLFGGSPGNYVISTIDNNPTHIDFNAWYSVIGYNGNQGNGGSILADNYSSKYLGSFYGPTSGYPNQSPTAAASAYINDNAEGSTFTNYAFLVSGVGGVPEPATWAMFLLGFGGIGLVLRRQRGRESLTAVNTR